MRDWAEETESHWSGTGDTTDVDKASEYGGQREKERERSRQGEENSFWPHETFSRLNHRAPQGCF